MPRARRAKARRRATPRVRRRRARSEALRGKLRDLIRRAERRGVSALREGAALRVGGVARAVRAGFAEAHFLRARARQRELGRARGLAARRDRLNRTVRRIARADLEIRATERRRCRARSRTVACDDAAVVRTCGQALKRAAAVGEDRAALIGLGAFRRAAL